MKEVIRILEEDGFIFKANQEDFNSSRVILYNEKRNIKSIIEFCEYEDFEPQFIEECKRIIFDLGLREKI